MEIEESLWRIPFILACFFFFAILLFTLLNVYTTQCLSSNLSSVTNGSVIDPFGNRFKSKAVLKIHYTHVLMIQDTLPEYLQKTLLCRDKFFCCKLYYTV